MRSKKIMALLLTTAAIMGMTLTGCGNKINEDAVFATLDDTTITMGVANFCAKYQQAMYDSFYMSYFGEDMWSKDIYGNGSTMTEDVKKDVADNLEEMYLLKAHMGDYDISLSDDDEAKITKAAEDFIAGNSKEAIKQIGAEDIENVKEMLRLNTIQSKMHDRIIKDADTKVTDEEAAQRTFSYVVINTNGYTDSDSNYVEYTEDDIAGLKETAASIAAAEDFDTAVTDAGYTVSTASYGSADDEDSTMDKSVLEAADQLSAGQVSGVIETDSALYVLRLDSEFDEEATATKKESMISQKQEDYYNDILDGWKEEVKWTLNEKEWAKVNFDDHFKQPETDNTEAADESIADTENINTTEAE